MFAKQCPEVSVKHTVLNKRLRYHLPYDELYNLVTIIPQQLKTLVMNSFIILIKKLNLNTRIPFKRF